MFHKPILADKELEDIAQVMKARLNIPNVLKDIVQQYNLTQQKVVYTPINNKENNELLQFPKLSMDDLYSISRGPYQIKDALSYYAEHLRENTFLVHKFNPSPRHPTANLKYKDFGINIENPLRVKAYMKSRYRGGKYHHIFVLVDRAN